MQPIVDIDKPEAHSYMYHSTDLYMHRK